MKFNIWKCRIPVAPCKETIPPSESTTSSSEQLQTTRLAVACRDDSQPDMEYESTITIGKLIGSGSFSCVYHVDLCDSPERETCIVHPSGLHHRSGEGCLAIKRLREVFPDERTERLASSDLIKEAKVLSSLPRHENIVSLRGLSLGFWDESTIVRPGRFLLLDQVDETLGTCLERLRKLIYAQPCGNRFSLKHRRDAICETQRHRIQVYALGVAKALQFLHQQGYVYRDLKPWNIGLLYNSHNACPVIKLFDFGLTRPCTEWTSGIPGSEASGTARYMAPEVIEESEHGLACDVHSFALVLWQICSLKRPYSNAITSKFLHQLISVDKTRPPLDRVKSLIIQDLLCACWNPNPSLRPNFDAITTILNDYAREVQ